MATPRREYANLSARKDVDSDDSDAVKDALEWQLDCFENVSGLANPDVEDGSWAYWEVTSGVLLVKIITVLIQVLIIGVMMRTYIENQGCIEHEHSFPEWL